MSENTNSRIQRPVGNSFFFTEPDKIIQSSDQAFGPFGDTDEEKSHQFRLTSMFDTTDGYAKAYAICSCRILIQPQIGTTDKVNLILKPTSQPLSGLKIKYFVLRGLAYGDFFTIIDDIAVVKSYTESEANFLESLNSIYTNLSSNGTTTPAFLAEYIGFDTQLDDQSKLINDYFTKPPQQIDSEDNFFDLPFVKEGTFLGRFMGNNCGIDVVLDLFPDVNEFDPYKYKFNLEYARAASSVLYVDNELDDSIKKFIRESCMSFWDISVYYSSHANNGVVKLTSDSDIPSEYTGTEIVNVISPFSTKHRIYFYIHTIRGRSYSFFNNTTVPKSLPNKFYIGSSLESIMESEFGSNKWPVVILDDSDEELIQIFFQLTLPDNTEAMLYFHLGEMTNMDLSCFANQHNLKDSNSSSITTIPIGIQTRITNQDNALVSVPQLIWCVFCVEGYQYFDLSETNVAHFRQSISFDHNFRIDSSLPTLSENGPSYLIDMDWQAHIFNHRGSSKTMFASLYNVGRITEKNQSGVSSNNGITFFAQTINQFQPDPNSSPKSTLIGNSVSQTSSSLENTFLQWNYIWEFVNIVDSLDEVLVLRVNPRILADRKLLFFGLLQHEIASLFDGFSDLVNPYISLVPIGEFVSYNENDEIKFRNYKKYKLVVLGENLSQELELFNPSSTIIVYSIDNTVFHTSEFTNFDVFASHALFANQPIKPR
jgi:hypothetical protein